MDNIQMVDLQAQFRALEHELRPELEAIFAAASYINGPHVQQFARNLEQYLGAQHVIPCANGTDALQIIMMGLGLKPGDEVIVPTFTYIATVEVIALLQLQPVMVDVDYDTFNLNPTLAEAAITPRTKAIVPVHLFGQCADLAPLLDIAKRHNLHVIEDTAQAIGAQYTLPDGTTRRAGTWGTAGATSFYPSKNLGCYGDGGAMMTNDDALAAELRMVANHGQQRRYYFDRVGVNSRLDSLQAAVLDVKLKRLDDYNARRRAAADYYDRTLAGLQGVQTPTRATNSTHVFHQYTLRVADGQRDALQQHLQSLGIPSVIFYPVCAHQQTAYLHYGYQQGQFPVAERLASEVLSLPMHSELSEEHLAHIVQGVQSFFRK